MSGRLILGAVLCATLIGCTGPLVYRPEKKVEQEVVVTMETGTKGLVLSQPDPKLNMATVAGIDTTGVGVRDDVHIWVFTNYTTAAKRTAVLGMAKNLQRVLVKPVQSVEEAKKLDQTYQDSLVVLKRIPGLSPGQADAAEYNLYQLTVNTPDRLEEYLRYNFLREGVNVPAKAKAPEPAKALATGQAGQQGITPVPAKVWVPGKGMVEAVKASEAGKAPEAAKQPEAAKAPEVEITLEPEKEPGEESGAAGKVPEAGKAQDGGKTPDPASVPH